MNHSFELNGAKVEVQCSPWKRVLDVLRQDLQVLGTKEGCGEGECGACSIVVDGKVVNSCLIPVAQVAGSTVETVEALGATGPLHRVQAKLVDLGGTQCGICTPGIAVAASRILEDETNLSRAKIRELLAGNICRCTGYQLIIDAVYDVAVERGVAAKDAR